MRTDEDLYVRGIGTLLASWEEYARGSVDARVQRMSGVAAAVFPNGPERAVYNNAVLVRDLGPTERRDAVDAMRAAYAAAGVDGYAAWVHESDQGMQAELASHGYVFKESTRAMGMSLDSLVAVAPELELGPPDWAEYLRLLGVSSDFLSRADPGAYHILVARLDGGNVATAMAFDHEGDCGVFNVGTIDAARRRGVGTALTARHLQDAVVRGCSTASLQSTPMAERLYASVGFRDLGRILEFVP